MKHTNHFTIYFSLAFLMISCGPKTEEAPTFDAVQLEEGFKNPPNEAKPRVWWHWMNGNVTKDGIQKDLDWMERTGIGGFQNFDANLFTPWISRVN
ncbi:glycosyl hydrolase [Flagellimonas baculiformis]|uniref:glycosyl hydrolase n=1 Tax=Flagellimonas baculiformis TaxID=3067310 RepID=UPI00296F0F47|nr:glycosyl hydrolase [Muricauda sp. D6]